MIFKLSKISNGIPFSGREPRLIHLIGYSLVHFGYSAYPRKVCACQNITFEK
jgi:hypothetical protein